jgi:DNA-binding transcriptional MerR regulator
VPPDDLTLLTIDELADATGTTTRRVRSLQTLGLLAHPALHGRTGLYDSAHRDRVTAILHLQEKGFSLESLRLLFDAVEAGRSLASVLGLPEPAPSAETDPGSGPDSAELYGFAELQRAPAARRRGKGRPLLSVVPTTVWDQSEAS